MSFEDKATGCPRTFTDEYPWSGRSKAGFKPGSGPPPGESYEELFAKHGRPIGPFEPGRQLPYRG